MANWGRSTATWSSPAITWGGTSTLTGKWRFRQEGLPDEVFMRNPRAMSTPVNGHRTRVMAGGRAFREGVTPTQWKFEGRIRTFQEYVFFQDWARKDKIIVIDHLGRMHEILPVAFEPVARRSGRNPLIPWLFDYTFKALYLRRIE